MPAQVELKASEAPGGFYHASAHGWPCLWSCAVECSLLLFVCMVPGGRRAWLVPLRAGVFARTPLRFAAGSFADDVPPAEAPGRALAIPRVNVPLARFTRRTTRTRETRRAPCFSKW